MKIGGGGGREGDWECGGCKNRNYAFRCFCNRCKQPRLLMDSKTPPDSKWLPRIGDWICAGCTNNNYASREKCKKCGQPKEVAAMPAIAMPGASLPTYPHYQKMNGGLVGKSPHQQSLPLSSNWTADGPDAYALQPVSLPKGWRNGDWICSCGFHNYASRLQCKSCNASAPPALGTKRLASEELAREWDNKRPNQGYTNGQQQLAVYAPYPNVSTGTSPNWHVPHPFLRQAPMPALLGKGAKQWRTGDWMCTNCDNHNYASRPKCNMCKAPRDMVSQSMAPT